MTRKSRNGFTLLEVLVALAIIAVMAAVMLPSLASRIRTANSANLTQNLKTVNDAIQKYRENVGYYPLQLVNLTTKPTTASTDACGSTLSTTDVNSWQGPYLALTVTTNGIQSGDASIENTLVRTPATTSSSTVMDGTLTVTADNVSTAVDADAEATLDAGSADANAGTIRYNSSTLVLTYVFPITGC